MPPHQAPLPSPPAPLPGVTGPKLAPFTPTAHADIEFIEFLGRENDKDSLVWKVEINGAGSFALKMFYFRHRDFLSDNQAMDLLRPLADPQLYVDYFDPFNCECRAYGRLKEENCEDLAIKAHGYLLLTPQQEADLAQKSERYSTLPCSLGDTDTLDGENFWGRFEQHYGLPVRAIVKDLASSAAYPTPTQAQGMWADLQVLHSLGIFVKDTHGGNYLTGKLVDFSRSWTMHHPAMDQIRFSTIQCLMLKELQQLLDHYYELANLGCIDPAAIPQDLEGFCSGDIDQYKNFPFAYNWLKWSTNADVDKAYVEQSMFVFDEAAP